MSTVQKIVMWMGGAAHSPFGNEHKVGHARGHDHAGTTRHHPRQDFPRRGRTCVTRGNKDGHVGGRALGPLYVLRCVNRALHVGAVEINWLDLHLRK